MDYDKVREANQHYLRELTIECRKVHDEIEVHVAPAEESINELQRIRIGQAELDNRINLMIRDVEAINSNLANLYSIKAEWENEELRVIALDREIEKRKEELKKFKSKTVEYHDSSEETIKIHSKEGNEKLNPAIQRRRKIDEVCCDGMLLYEEEKDGNGIRGK